MSFQCTLFSNTGFNAVNIPDSPGLLAVVGNPTTVPALEIVQNRFLSSVRVHATWSAVKDVDYCMVGDFYYMVEDVRMLNGDTAELSLLPDFITSAGGPGALTFIDGLTERVHVSDDAYGKYNEYDELMAPAEPLQLRHFSVVPSAAFNDLIESTVELVVNGTAQEALTYTDSVSGETVTVPQNPPLTAATDFTVGGATVVGFTGFFDGTNATVKEGVQRARSLGAESAIISHYKLPSAYGTPTGSLGWYGQISGVDRDQAITLPFRYGSYTPANLKVLYSDFTKFGLLSVSGNKVEFDPADIYDGGSSPTLRIVTDPRPDGKPYFRYKSYLGDTSLDMFFTNSVAGAEWEQVPLIYTQKSGGAIDRLEYETSALKQYDDMKKSQTMAGIGSVVGGAMTGARFGASMGGVTGAIAGVALGALGGSVMGMYSGYQIEKAYKEKAQNELQKYAINNLIVSPELQFPYNANTLRDALGNGVVCYRYQYSDNDLRRIDKILNMYGYKHSKAITASDFTGRTGFNYVKAHGAEVTNLPKWWADGVAAQLTAGTRVWHTAPSPSYY
ncbi:MAG: hypothetical protein J6B01_02685 [Ruminococcus sp.]|nr:hypothetical protein [Ruminococcus sp.]